jgi:hypothetical protein
VLLERGFDTIVPRTDRSARPSCGARRRRHLDRAVSRQPRHQRHDQLLGLARSPGDALPSVSLAARPHISIVLTVTVDAAPTVTLAFSRLAFCRCRYRLMRNAAVVSFGLRSVTVAMVTIYGRRNALAILILKFQT